MTTDIAGSYVVLDGRGRVVVIFSGTEAASAAEEWAARGYRVVLLAPVAA